MHMLHMHISIDIIITLSFFITDFLLSSVLNGVSALDGGIVTLSAGFVNPLFYIPAICKKIRQQSPTVFVCFAARIILSYPPKHSLTCCAFTQRGMKKSHQAALDGSQSGTKASQNSPPAMAANNLDHFLPRHVRGKKYFSAQQVPKARSGPQTFWQQNRKILRQFLIWYRRHGRRVTGVEENTACQGQRRQQQIGNPQQDGQQIPQQLATR